MLKKENTKGGKKTYKRISYFKRMGELKRLTDIQCSKGNYDYDRYMHGMANGMILAVSIMDKTTPQFIDMKREEFISDLTKKEKESTKLSIGVTIIAVVMFLMGFFIAVAIV